MNRKRKDFINEMKQGDVIVGKWYQKSYLIKRKLGAGTVGTVYLCQYNKKYAALKLSNQSSSIATEVNVLKSLHQVQEKRLGPDLLDVDDWESPHGVIHSFYVMEYLQGENLVDFVKGNGNEWIGILMFQLLKDLERLHQIGWVLGDLKTENLLVLSAPTRLRWVDVGGMTQVGRSVKEFTEFYDRGYWGKGTRRAEPSYDLFSIVMVFLTIFYPNRFNRSAQQKQLIFQKIDEVDALVPYQSCLKKAILGKYDSSTQMIQDLTQLMYNQQRRRRDRRYKNRITWLSFVIESGGILLIAAGYYVTSLLLP